MDDEHMSDYTDAENEQAPALIPALPLKGGLGKKRKAGGFGKKVKVFADRDQMLAMVDEVNAVQEGKVNLLIERDVRNLGNIIQRTYLSVDRALQEIGSEVSLQEAEERVQKTENCIISLYLSNEITYVSFSNRKM